jgi:hypothetical protein
VKVIRHDDELVHQEFLLGSVLVQHLYDQLAHSIALQKKASSNRLRGDEVCIAGMEQSGQTGWFHDQEFYALIGSASLRLGLRQSGAVFTSVSCGTAERRAPSRKYQLKSHRKPDYLHSEARTHRVRKNVSSQLAAA